MKPAIAAVLLFATLQGASAADVLRVEASEPRAYGWRVGDRVQREVSVFAPAGWELDAASLPKAGGRGQAIELRSVQLRSSAEDGGRRHELKLEYQVFLAPGKVRIIEIPPFRLRFAGPGRIEEPLVEAWPVMVAPLTGPEISSRRGLGEMQPDHAPALIDTAPARSRLAGIGLMATLLLSFLAVVHFGPPWRVARSRPFGVAWRQLRRLPAQPAASQWREALRQLHAAFNRSAGEVLFEGGMARFVAAQPAFAPLQADMARFLALSRQEFFGSGPRQDGDAAWLVDLCRRCHAAERGLLA
jgi:mxaA protein